MGNEWRVVQIRPMCVQDVERVIAIADGLKEAPHWPRDTYLKAVEPGAVPARILLVAEDREAQVVGFAVTTLVPPQAELECIAVVREAQRQGVARGLLGAVLIELKKCQITEVMLEVRESNYAARRLYDALDFAETGRRPGYYTDPQEDALLLQRSVS